MVNHRNQPGNPEKAGELLVKIAQSGKLPKRLPLGSDAVRIIESELQRRIARACKPNDCII